MWGDKLEIVQSAAEKALSELQATPKKKKKGSEIYAKAIELDENLSSNVNEQVFKSYLSNIARDPESKISKDIGSHGYYLEPQESLIIETPEPEEQSPSPDTIHSKKIEREKLLYPILEAWLQSKGYRTKDTSQMKIMRSWGNPDMTGIIVEETLGAYDIDVSTIEAKITADNFKYDFFEAVSHKRFANRVYYSFAAKSNFLRENQEELRYYSELYKVGVVVVIIEDNHFKKFISGELKEIDSDMVDVYELFSTPYETRLKRWQKEFLNALKITDTKSLWVWGSN